MNFQTDVIERSETTAVLVDFWAPWCGPCRVLGPVLDDLAQEAGDRWTLVKVNTDEHPELMQEYGIRGIPAVKLFVAGNVVGEFTGALPKAQIKRWLAEYLPDPRLTQLEALTAHVEAGFDGALDQLEAFVAAHPDLTAAQLTLAQALIVRDPARADALTRNLPLDRTDVERVEDIRTLVRLVQHDTSTDGQPVAAKLALAQDALGDGEDELAIKALIDAVVIDRSYAGDLPRLAILALFRLLGREHSLVKTYRRAFEMALY
ncbi:MAG: thioredoxin [Bacteroidota bacterium]